MASKEGPKKAVEVTAEDQANINNFNTLNNKMHELEAQISGRKKALEELEDAGNELMLADDEEVRYVVGECFVHMDKDAAEERLQSMSETVTKEVARLTGELDQVKEKMKGLKAALYGKFGKSINLEE